MDFQKMTVSQENKNVKRWQPRNQMRQSRYQHDHDSSGDGDDDDAFSSSSRNVDLTRDIVGRSYGSLDHMLT